MEPPIAQLRIIVGYISRLFLIPVVPLKAVADVSKIGNL
jgi:hypothetical protein